MSVTKRLNLNYLTKTENKTSLSDFAGRRVLIWFYPKASTPGCTAQGCNLRDNHDAFVDQNVEILGISMDSVKRQNNFATKQGFPFRLLADETGEVTKSFGAYKLKKFMGRSYDGDFTDLVLDRSRWAYRTRVRQSKNEDTWGGCTRRLVNSIPREQPYIHEHRPESGFGFSRVSSCRASQPLMDCTRQLFSPPERLSLVKNFHRYLRARLDRQVANAQLIQQTCLFRTRFWRIRNPKSL